MVSGPAIGIDDDLASGEAAVAVRTADDEFAGRIDQVTHVSLEHGLRQHRLDDVFDHRLLDLLVLHLGGVLRGQHHGFDRVGFTVYVADRYLRFGVGPQPRQAAVAAQLRLAFNQPVRKMNCHRHQHRGLIACIPEHQSLVAGPLLRVETAAIDTLRDVR